MTTANKITILRILLVPFFVVEVLYYFKSGEETHRILGLISFAVAAILDGVDGYIARRYNQKSELGAILDPLADKLLLVSGIVLLSLPNQHYLKTIPLWLTATIISRDVMVLIGLAVIQITCGKVIVRPRLVGKLATVLQMITVVWSLNKWSDAWLPGWTLGAAICTAISGLLYVLDGMRQLSASPTSLPNDKR
jgi:CDP-diacylglycerol--glycerol-3-phosphate 3-phosphatidyltransferase